MANSEARSANTDYDDRMWIFQKGREKVAS